MKVFAASLFALAASAVNLEAMMPTDEQIAEAKAKVDSRLTEAFDTIDANDNGMIDVDELETIFELLDTPDGKREKITKKVEALGGVPEVQFRQLLKKSIIEEILSQARESGATEEEINYLKKKLRCG